MYLVSLNLKLFELLIKMNQMPLSQKISRFGKIHPILHETDRVIEECLDIRNIALKNKVS